MSGISDFIDNKTEINLVNTNARSLKPKINSFIDCYKELDLTFGIITETWLADGVGLDRQSEDLLLGSGLVIHTLNRPPGNNGVCHGGVAIITRDSTTKSSIYKFPNPDSFEVLAVSASVSSIKRKFFVIGAYIPPNYTVPKAKASIQYISDIILDIKTKYEDPYIAIAGDFNQWKAEDAVRDYPDINEISTPPTRQGRNIDRVFINWKEDLVEAGCLPPLESEEIDEHGTRRFSDHMVQYAISRLKKKEKIKWEVFTYRPFHESGAASFEAELRCVDWSGVTERTDTNAAANHLQLIFDDLMERHFPLKTVKVKEGDLPWINGTARKMIRKKRAIFKAEARSERWWKQREAVDSYLQKRQDLFLQRQRDKMLGPDASRQFYKNVKAFKNAEKPKSFDVRDLRPGKTDESVATEVATYFNRISCEFSPLEPNQIPSTYLRPLPYLTHDAVAKMLKTARKSSMVKGDLFPKLVDRCANILAIPLSSIYNNILDTFVWPAAWKREYVTTIPKKKMPEQLSDLRNISCTLLISKVFESHVLQCSMEEITVKNNQYGGVKGCSTTHMIIELLQQICENAEDYRSATVLTAIDYSKAFNRVSYQHCLEAFRKKGASTNILRLLATFLSNRTMSVRVGQHWSHPLPVSGGCPQGSILGVWLFNVTTDDLEDDFMKLERVRLGLDDPPTDGDLPNAVASPPTLPPVPPTGSSPHAGGHQPSMLDLSPIHDRHFRLSDQHIEFHPNVVNVPTSPAIIITPPREEKVGTQVLTEKPVMIVKYVDDNMSVEKINFGTVQAVLINNKFIKSKLAIPSQNAFRSITTNAKKKGMLVNADKTNMVCISDSLSYTPITYFYDSDDNKIECGQDMKVLGFWFSSKPTVSLHVDKIVKQLRCRYWSLTHLGKVGFSKEELVAVYKSTILPIADYCAPAYHPMTTDIHDQLLENAQVGALRRIFGYGLSARKLREKAGVSTLRERRIELTDKFATKCAASSRFSHWFPLRAARRTTRSAEIYQEEFAKCDRLKNSPLFYMRRRLNGKDGKIYGERNKIYRENFALAND